MPSSELITTEREARLLLARYLAGIVPKTFVVSVFGALSWEIANRGDVPRGLKALVEATQLALDEYTGGYRPEEGVRKLLLGALMGTYAYDVSQPMMRIEARSVSSSTELAISVIS